MTQHHPWSFLVTVTVCLSIFWVSVPGCLDQRHRTCPKTGRRTSEFLLPPKVGCHDSARIKSGSCYPDGSLKKSTPIFLVAIKAISLWRLRQNPPNPDTTLNFLQCQLVRGYVLYEALGLGSPTQEFAPKHWDFQTMSMQDRWTCWISSSLAILVWNAGMHMVKELMIYISIYIYIYI